MSKRLGNYRIGPGFLSVAEAEPIIARHVIDEAKLGNPYPLLARVKADMLTETEREFIVDCWESGKSGKRGKRGEGYIRRVRDCLICLSVETLTAAGIKKEAAVTQVAKTRGLKRRQVLNILALCNRVV